MEREFKIECSDKGTKEEAIEFIRNGGLCVHKIGVWNKWFNYGTRPLDSEKALKWVERGNFTFGERYFRLRWLDHTNESGETVRYLGFDEPSQRDLD